MKKATLKSGMPQEVVQFQFKSDPHFTLSMLILSAGVQWFNHCLCLALIVGLQHIVDIGNTTFCGHIITNVAKLLSVLNLLDTMWYD